MCRRLLNLRWFGQRANAEAAHPGFITHMNTTSLFVDLLISGIQVALWLCLLIGSVLGVDPKLLKEIKGWEVMLAAVLRKIRQPFHLDDSPSVMKLLTRTKDEFLSRYFEYVRIRIRISRSSTLNFGLITIFGELFILTRWQPAFGLSRWLLAILVGSLGLALTAFAFYSWYRITLTFSKKLAYGLMLLPGEQRGREEQIKEAVAEIVN